MGWLSDFVSDPVGTVVDTASTVVDTATSAVNSTVKAVVNHPIELAAIAAAASGLPYGAAEAGATTAAVSSGTVAETSLGTLTASDLAGYSGIDLGGVGGSPATWLNATSSGITDYVGSGWNAGNIAASVTSGLNLATSALKLGSLKKMTTTPTASGLTNALSGMPTTIVTTPNGPETVASQGIGSTTAQPSQGMDTQTIFVIAAAAAAIWIILKKG